MHNIMPHEESGVSPIEVWSRIKINHHDLLHTHTGGCPAYVLSPKLREGGHIPKWNLGLREDSLLDTAPYMLQVLE